MEFKVRCMYSPDDCYACERAQRCLIKDKRVYVLSSVWLVVRYVAAILIFCFCGCFDGLQGRRGGYRRDCWKTLYGGRLQRCTSCQAGQSSPGRLCWFCREAWRDSLDVVGIGRMGWAIWNKYMNDDIHYTFRETDFRLSHSKGGYQMEYSAIQDVVESPDYFFLFVNAKNAYILPKRDFTQRDIAAFGSFIAEKCGKEIIKIK